MRGDDRVRRCAECKLDVMNLEALTTAEAKALLGRMSCGERVCVRYFRRFDGTVLTKDCEGGLRRAWKEAKRRRAVDGALAGFGYLGLALLTVYLVLCAVDDGRRRARSRLAEKTQPKSDGLDYRKGAPFAVNDAY